MKKEKGVKTLMVPRMERHVGVDRAELILLQDEDQAIQATARSTSPKSRRGKTKTINKGAITRAPLQNIPVVDVPFKRVTVDLVGLIGPKSEDGHRYILTLVDYATRYPEAVPLKRIDAETVAEATVRGPMHILKQLWTKDIEEDEVRSSSGYDKPVEVLRDTGCVGVVLRRDLISDDQLTGRTCLIARIDNTMLLAEEAWINVETPFLSGGVKACTSR
ncbi:hypothetical protein EGW08_004210 [Elysia chlorotica]|uniref:Integrase catalytic domain-containing protein n=1 Tax=Elysia chlorotica TaxID=188477 RepID=A0A433U2J1_ELYCH|nr:hypothetical protein EGW08_004210 [Elysia chlorotica]